MIASDLGRRIMLPSRYPENASRSICLAVFDNCLVKFGTSYEGIRGQGDGSLPYLFINWLIFPVHRDIVPGVLDSLSPEGIYLKQL